MAAFSQAVFSDAFSWMKSFVFWLKFYWSPKGTTDNNPAPIRHQAIIWTNADLVHWRIYAAPVLNIDLSFVRQHTVMSMKLDLPPVRQHQTTRGW